MVAKWTLDYVENLLRWRLEQLDLAYERHKHWRTKGFALWCADEMKHVSRRH
jgi:hypothetical protein